LRYDRNQQFFALVKTANAHAVRAASSIQHPEFSIYPKSKIQNPTMDTLLTQALLLTLVGMTMTFAAIALLVVGMYVLTTLIKDERPQARKPVVVKVERNIQSEAEAKQISQAVFPGVTLASEETLTTDDQNHTDEAENRHRAAAVAVAVALAMQSTSITNTAPVDNWNAFIRARHLAQRQRYNARRNLN
jgi:Na+-transporting methylmalonyl-CoA/oxaloacetate decarboxylase gamma subunit